MPDSDKPPLTERCADPECRHPFRTHRAPGTECSVLSCNCGAFARPVCPNCQNKMRLVHGGPRLYRWAELRCNSCGFHCRGMKVHLLLQEVRTLP